MELAEVEGRAVTRPRAVLADRCVSGPGVVYGTFMLKHQCMCAGTHMCTRARWPDQSIWSRLQNRLLSKCEVKGSHSLPASTSNPAKVCVSSVEDALSVSLPHSLFNPISGSGPHVLLSSILCGLVPPWSPAEWGRGPGLGSLGDRGILSKNFCISWDFPRAID